MIGPVEDRTIAGLLAPGGTVAHVFEGFEARSGQLVMAEAVQSALDGEEPVLIEAPCGIGKSLTYALAKGINNYFCPRNFQKAEAEGVAAKLNRREREQWQDLGDQWAGANGGGERWRGDLSDLDYELLPVVKSWATTTSDDCPGKKCRMAAECPARAARKRWHSSDVVVTNYHLFFIDMAMGHGILPDWDFLVLDEAHKLGDIAREFFGRRASRGSVKACTNLLDFAPKQKEAVEAASRRFFAQVESARRRPDYKARLKNNGMLPAAAELATALETAAGVLGKAGGVELDAEARHKLLSAESRCRDHANFVLAADRPREFENEVFFVEGEEGRGDRK